MKRLSLFCAIAGLCLGSASLPQPRAAESPRLTYVAVPCMAVSADPCAALALGPAEVTRAAATPVAREEKSAAVAPAPAEPTATIERDDGTDGVRIVISLPEQQLYVFRDGEFIDSSPVSTGRRGHRTPVGTFPILQKKVHHRSTKYDDAPMPYMQRLTWYGIALHAGYLPGYPASHGCIRLPRSFAKKLYGLTDYSTRVTITDERTDSPEDALALI